MKNRIWPASLVLIFWATAYAQTENPDPVDPLIEESVSAPTVEKPNVAPVSVDESVEAAPAEATAEEAAPAVDEPAPPPAIARPKLKRPSAGAGDEPDLVYEAQLHDIYLNFNSKKMAQDEWKSIAGERQSEVYNIQKGDNLWNISKTLFSDGNYWPKIWSLNGSIENPHLITEGNSIKFLMGTESEAPSFTVTETSQDESEETERPNRVVHEDVIEIPPPVNAPKPVVRNLPPSLPQWQQDVGSNKYDYAGFDYTRRPVLDLKSRVKIPAYYDENETAGIGVVREVETGGKTASQFQYIYVELPAGQYKKGDRFMVVRNMGEIKSSDDSIDDDLGYQIQVQGEITLEEKTDHHAKDDSSKEMYRALITQNIAHVEVGSVLVKDHWLYGDFSDRGPKSLVVAQIVGGSNDNKSRLFGQGSVAFLNRGSQDGLAVGQILPIRSNRQLRDPESIVWENARPIGYLKVVKVTPKGATTIVLKSFEDIFAGDMTGQGPLIPTTGLSTAPAKGSDSEELDEEDSNSDKASVLEEMEEEQAEDESTVEDADQSASSDDDSFDNEDDTTDQSSDEDSDLDSELE